MTRDSVRLIRWKIIDSGATQTYLNGWDTLASNIVLLIAGTGAAGIAPLPKAAESNQHHPWLFEQAFERPQELCCERAIDDAVIGAERHRHHSAGDQLIVADDRALL